MFAIPLVTKCAYINQRQSKGMFKNTDCGSCLKRFIELLNDWVYDGLCKRKGKTEIRLNIFEMTLQFTSMDEISSIGGIAWITLAID